MNFFGWHHTRRQTRISILLNSNRIWTSSSGSSNDLMWIEASNRTPQSMQYERKVGEGPSTVIDLRLITSNPAGQPKPPILSGHFVVSRATPYENESCKCHESTCCLPMEACVVSVVMRVDLGVAWRRLLFPHGGRESVEAKQPKTELHRSALMSSPGCVVVSLHSQPSDIVAQLVLFLVRPHAE